MSSQNLPSSMDNRGALLNAVTWSLTATATVFLGARLYIASRHRYGLGWDDFFLFSAWAIALAVAVVTQMVVINSDEHRADAVQPSNRESLLYYQALSEIMIPLPVALVKISVVIFVLRRFSRVVETNWVRWACYTDLVLSIPTTTALLFVLCFQCVPLHLVWTKGSESDKCLNQRFLAVTWTIQTSTGAASNFVTSVLPLLLLRNLQIDTRFKMWLCGLTGLGLGITGVSVWRAVHGHTNFHDQDATWTSVYVTVGAVVESTVGIMAACLPICIPATLKGLESIRGKLSPRQSSSQEKAESLSSTENKRRPFGIERIFAKPLRLNKYATTLRQGDSSGHIIRTFEVRIESTTSLGESDTGRNGLSFSCV